MATYIRFDSTDMVTSTDQVITSTWSDNTNLLEQTLYTSSLQYIVASASSQGQFYLDVYNLNPETNSEAAIQMAIAYGNRKGSGSVNFTTEDADSDGYSAARSIYGQYRTLVYGDENTDFQFGNYTPDDFYALNIERARYKYHLKTGWNLKLENSGVTRFLTDDSLFNAGSSTITNIGRQFNIISGTNGAMYTASQTDVNLTTSGSYGFFYPDAGLVLLNGDALRAEGISDFTAFGANDTASCPVTDRTASLDFFNKLSQFELDSVEDLTAKYLFARIKNGEFNYSGNPSFIDDEGNLRFTSMISQPTTYITTVGLYNDNNELLAVAKMSQPLAKDFTKEALIRIKLDF